ncbi:MAG: hypothetical protein WCE67_06130, partial [Azonexus sp.]
MGSRHGGKHATNENGERATGKTSHQGNLERAVAGTADARVLKSSHFTTNRTLPAYGSHDARSTC